MVVVVLPVALINEGTPLPAPSSNGRTRADASFHEFAISKKRGGRHVKMTLRS